MKKMMIFLFISFILLVSSIFSAGLVLAEKENNSGSSDKSEKLEGKFNGGDASKTKIEVEKDEDGRRVVTKKIISVVDGVEIEKEIVTKSKGGKTIVEVKGEKKFFDFEGNERKIKVEIKERREDGKDKRFFKVETDGQEVESDLELNETHDGNMTKIKVRLKDGSNKEIKVLPEKASETARERLRLKFVNESVVIKEIKHNNIPRVVYHIEGDQGGKFLGIFKIALRAQTDIDAETGEVVQTNGPWWSFLVSKD